VGSDDPAVEAFARALAAARKAAKVTQKELAAKLDISQGSISAYETGEAVPKHPYGVFDVERAIPVPPGSLSRFFGYLPVEAVNLAVDVESAIYRDPAIPDELRDVILGSVRGALSGAREPRGGRSGRPRKRRES